jgi:phytoene/squalene synthetase
MLTLQDLQIVARQRAKASNLTAYLLVRLFTKADRRDYLFLIYAYFRWIDDMVDSPGTSKEEKERFIEQQRGFLANLYDGQACLETCTLEEQFAQWFVAYDREIGFLLKDDVLGMFSVLKHDLDRDRAPWSAEEMYEFICLESKSYINMIRFSCGETGNYKGANRYDEGVACKLAHLLRDFVEDLNQGTMNISRDDLQKYEINLDKGNHENFRLWVKDQVMLAGERFRMGKHNLSNSSRLRYKIASQLYCAKYEDILAMIEKDNYFLRAKYRRTPLTKARFLFKSILVILLTTVDHYSRKSVKIAALKHDQDSVEISKMTSGGI